MGIFSRSPPHMAFRKSFRVPAIAPGEQIEYDREDTLRHFRSFSPFFTFSITNASNAELEVLFDYNPNSVLPCARQGAASSKNIPFTSFLIKNTSVSISTGANDVIIIIERIQ